MITKGLRNFHKAIHLILFFIFMNGLKKKSINFDYMVVLQPTSPLRKHEDINRACNLIKKINAKVF